MKQSPNSRRALPGPLLFILLAAAAGIAAFGATAKAAEHDTADAFANCMKGDAGAIQCLAELGDPYDWDPTEAACRFVGDKVEAIIEAGGDAKWRDLFYNERCVRLGLPHSLTAAEPGARIIPDAPYRRCTRVIRNPGTCQESLGRHSEYPYLNMFPCEFAIDTLRNRRDVMAPLLQPNSGLLSDSRLWHYAFGNERCWRLGVSHFEKK